MLRLSVARFVAPAALVAACSATAPLPEQPSDAGTGGVAGQGGAAGAKTGGNGGKALAGNGGDAGKGPATGGTDAGASGGDAGAAGQGEAGQGDAGTSSGGKGGKGQTAGNAGQTSGGAGGTKAGASGATSGGNDAGGAGSGGAAGGSDPFGGGGSDAGAGGACDVEKVAAGDGLSCTSINYITTGDPCLACDRGPSLYFCEGESKPPSPGCSTLPEYGAGYFCCDKSVCTPQPGGCDDQVRYHCPPDATVPSACKKLGGDPTSYCCPK